MAMSLGRSSAAIADQIDSEGLFVLFSRAPGT